jgi:hypothetical protein
VSLAIIAAFNGLGSTPITEFSSINTSGGRTFSVLSGISLTNPSALKRTGFSFLRADRGTCQKAGHGVLRRAVIF